MNDYEKKRFFEHYVRKYYKYAVEAEKKYKKHLESYNYNSLEKLVKYGLKNGESILTEYVRIAIKDLEGLDIQNISETEFIEKYLKKYYIFKENFNKIEETYEDIYKYKKELKNNVSNNHNPSSVRFYPKNISSISTSIGLNILANSGYVFSIAKDTFKIERYINSEMQNLLNQIKNSNILVESFSQSVFNILRAFFDCIKDKLDYNINIIYSDEKLKSELHNILYLADDYNTIQACNFKLRKKSEDKKQKKEKELEELKKELNVKIIIDIFILAIILSIIFKLISFILKLFY